ncbi:MAG: hypothetical protein EBY22_11535, partial [Gammaproteobacteria bacterium]|nr:hypothetical protein [Gammaproteobacteria bacterium]
LREKLQSLTYQNDQLADNLDSKSSDYRELDARLRETARLLSAKTDEAQSLERLLEEEKDKTFSLSQQVAELTGAISELSDSLQKKSELADSLQEQLSLKEKTLLQLQSHGNSKASEAENLRGECASLREQIEIQRHAVSELSSELGTLKFDYETLQRSFKESQSSNENLRDEIRELGERLQETKKAATQKEVALDTIIFGLKQTVANLELTVQQVSKKLESQTTETRLTSERLATVTQQLEIANLDKEHNQETIRDLEEQRDKIIITLSENQIEISQLREKLQSLTYQNDQLADNLDSKSSDYRELDARLIR